MNVPKLVLVEWEDACDRDAGSTWVDREEHGTPTWSACVMRSVGFVLYDGDEGMILTPCVSADTIAPREQIPKGMIRRVTTLQKAFTVVPE